MQHSASEENYLKAIYSIAQGSNTVSTTTISKRMQTKASSVTDMLRKLADKGLVNYIKYKGVSLTEQGTQAALRTLRKHRLWETFLVEKLGFGWHEVHEVAEQLEHIQSPKLTTRLAGFLNNPDYDPPWRPDSRYQWQLTESEFTAACALRSGRCSSPETRERRKPGISSIPGETQLKPR
jgi:DtxR family Mn-dependent transcriptional regulator